MAYKTEGVLITTYNGYVTEPICVTTEELAQKVIGHYVSMGWEHMSSFPIKLIQSEDQLKELDK